MFVLSILSMIGLGCSENDFFSVRIPQNREVSSHRPEWKELDSEEYQINISVEQLDKRSVAIDTIQKWLDSNATRVIPEEEYGPDDGYLEKESPIKRKLVVSKIVTSSGIFDIEQRFV